MFFNFFLAAFWFLTLVLPVGDYHKYTGALSNTRIIGPDKDEHIVLVGPLSLVWLPPPAPMPRYSPLVVPVYTPIEARVPMSNRFNREKRIISIYKWVDKLLAHVADLLGRPRPTKTSNLPTKVFAPVHPAPPTPSFPTVHPSPILSPISSAFELAALWEKYKLATAWILLISSSFIITSARFLSGDYPTLNEAPNTPDLDLIDSIIDIYLSLDYSSTTFSPVYGLPTELPNTQGSALTDDATALAIWIDTKTGAEGTNETISSSVGGSTLEPALSSSSIGPVRLETEETPIATTTPNHASDPLAAYGDRFPPGGQVHSPRSKGWLEGFIRHVAYLQNRGNLYGRVYDGWAGNPHLRREVEDSESEMGSDRDADPTSSGPDSFLSSPPISSLDSSLDSTNDGISSSPSPVADMSTTVSQGFLYDQLGGFIGGNTVDTAYSSPSPIAELTFTVSQESLYDQLGSLIGGDMVDPTHSSPSPVAELTFTVSQDSLYEQLDGFIGGVMVDSAYSPPIAVAELTVTVSQGSLYEQLAGLIEPQDQNGGRDGVEIRAGVLDVGVLGAQADGLSLTNFASAQVPLPPSPSIEVDLLGAIGINPLEVPLPPSPLVPAPSRRRVSRLDVALKKWYG